VQDVEGGALSGPCRCGRVAPGVALDHGPSFDHEPIPTSRRVWLCFVLGWLREFEFVLDVGVLFDVFLLRICDLGGFSGGVWFSLVDCVWVFVSFECIVVIVDEIERDLVLMDVREILLVVIGEKVMMCLCELDEVVYVRFVLVYCLFCDIGEFVAELG
jgi:Predicted transcriptional regulator, consists of a Zn-ribbon and ATP-cone domains